MGEFLTLYPGLYLPEEQQAIETLQAQIQKDLARSALSFSELTASAEGQSRGVSFRVRVEPSEIQSHMKKLDPMNPIWFDRAAAEKAGWEGLPAPEGWSCPKGGYFGGMGRALGDETCVKEHHHYCTYHAPIYQGDTLYPVLVDQGFWDATPYEGSQWRTWALRGTAKVYNQHGTLVLTQTCGVEECFRIHSDPQKRTWQAENVGVREPEFVNHKIHLYTDEDWAYIRSLWAQERRQGQLPCYYEDVEIGDRPPITVDGPYTCPGKGGMVMSVSAPSMGSWYLREHWGVWEKTVSRDEFGVYHVEELEQQEGKARQKAMEDMMLARPKPAGEKKKEGKPPLGNSPVEVRGKATMDNFTGRDSALRCIHNWMGDRGRVVALSWCIGATGGTQPGIPRYPNRTSPFLKVPGMEHRHTEVHGEEGDLSINRLCVTGKHTDEQGRGLVELTWWCETIEGQIHTEGTATVALPRRS